MPLLYDLGLCSRVSGHAARRTLRLSGVWDKQEDFVQKQDVGRNGNKELRVRDTEFKTPVALSQTPPCRSFSFPFVEFIHIPVWLHLPFPCKSGKHKQSTIRPLSQIAIYLIPSWERIKTSTCFFSSGKKGEDRKREREKREHNKFLRKPDPFFKRSGYQQLLYVFSIRERDRVIKIQNGEVMEKDRDWFMRNRPAWVHNVRHCQDCMSLFLPSACFGICDRKEKQLKQQSFRYFHSLMFCYGCRAWFYIHPHIYTALQLKPLENWCKHIILSETCALEEELFCPNHVLKSLAYLVADSLRRVRGWHNFWRRNISEENAEEVRG